jgi:CheY-like chemotaxis protein/HPt (histidine-containing phosphotransfer) domain-containing protein
MRRRVFENHERKSGITLKTMQPEVLIIDDYQAVASLLGELFTGEGCSVSIANNGQQAIDMLNSGKRFDMILTDMEMPGMNGIETIRCIRAMSGLAAVPIICIGADDGIRSACIESGMNDVAQKPLSLEDVKMLIARYVTKDICGDVSITEKVTSEKTVAVSVTEPSAPDMIFDYSRALKEFKGDAELLSRIIKEFVCVITAQIKTIEGALEIQNMETVRREVHSIKGGALNICAANLATSALSLENAARLKNFPQAQMEFRNLTDAITVFSISAMRH